MCELRYYENIVYIVILLSAKRHSTHMGAGWRDLFVRPCPDPHHICEPQVSLLDLF